ncbi:MAG: DUF1559 domain-containing protein [Pirellulales bacterium]|nr:DUF1559 domain-containing protein [Pirellulales bacterium]
MTHNYPATLSISESINGIFRERRRGAFPSSLSPFPSLRAFTLIELLVVITIIGVLVALILPAVQAAREAARRANCSNNLKQIGLALHAYHDARGSFPPGNIQRTAGNCPGMEEPGLSYSTRFGNWMIAILPYIEKNALYDGYDFSHNNESAENESFREATVSTYLCPSDYTADGPIVPASGPAFVAGAKYAPGSYRAVTGKSVDGLNYLDSEMMYEYERRLRGPIHVAGVWGYGCETLAHVRDGASNTLLVGEHATATNPGRRTFWAYSFAYYAQSGVAAQERILWADYDRCAEAGGPGLEHPCKRGWGSFHPGGLHFLLCDGTVHFISTSVNMELLADLATIAGGEIAALP